MRYSVIVEGRGLWVGGPPMNLREEMDAYIELKQANGCDYEWGAQAFRSFHKHVGGVTVAAIRARQVLTFLDSPQTPTSTWHTKYSLLRGFFLFCIARGSILASPMPEVRPMAKRPFVSYIYSRSELHRLLITIPQVQSKNCKIETRTFHTLVLFLYGTGALVGEALRMRREDVDFKRRRIKLYSRKFDRQREIPIGRELIEVLRMYCKFKNHHRGVSADCAFFLNRDGYPLNVQTLDDNFKTLRHVSGIADLDGDRHQPTLHDLRHTFAVHRLTAWMKSKVDLNRMIPALSVYMGQTGLASAGRYLNLTPERFRAQLERLSPKRGRRKWRNDPALMKFVDSL